MVKERHAGASPWGHVAERAIGYPWGGVPSRPSSFSSRTQLSLPTARSERNDSELSHHAYPQQRKLSHPASQMMPPTLGEAEMTPAPKRPAPIIGRRSYAPSRSPDRIVPTALRNRHRARACARSWDLRPAERIASLQFCLGFKGK